jgi:hypothetical protein
METCRKYGSIFLNVSIDMTTSLDNAKNHIFIPSLSHPIDHAAVR